MCRAKILRTYLTSVKLAYQTGMQLLWDIRRNCATCNTPVGRSSFSWSSGNSCTLVREPTVYFGFHRDTVFFPELFVSHSVFHCSSDRFCCARLNVCFHIQGTVIRVFSVPDGQKLFEFRRGVKRYVNIARFLSTYDCQFASAIMFIVACMVLSS